MTSESDGAANAVGVLDDILAVNNGAARVGREDGRKDANHRGLTRSVGTEKAKNLTFGNIEGNAVKSPNFPVSKGTDDVSCLDCELRHRGESLPES